MFPIQLNEKVRASIDPLKKRVVFTLMGVTGRPIVFVPGLKGHPIRPALSYEELDDFVTHAPAQTERRYAHFILTPTSDGISVTLHANATKVGVTPSQWAGFLRRFQMMR